ncbi:MAG: hypothetical protein A3205_02245 [Methanomassiliicoccales archaeon Mx-03]|nr:MAG: hypothetical protein A3205_02245 [Methanomassiliicoccales archaeon Mx-03]
MKGCDHSYGHDPRYCHPGSDVLRNRPGITDGELLDRREASMTSIRMMEQGRGSSSSINRFRILVIETGDVEFIY